MSQTLAPHVPLPAAPDDLLLVTKLHILTVPDRFVPRPRALAHLRQGLAGRLTLLSAPPGSGKTTLLAEWLQERPCPAAWLSLDESDNDPGRFLRYLIAALQTVAPGLGAAATQLLRLPQPPVPEVVLGVLINDLATLPGDTLLVLEDFHVITALPLQQALAYLVEHLSERVHVVIATRADPALPLARLRAKGQLVEVRADQLRFTPEEATAYLNESMGLGLAASEVAALEARTEGWAVGLQMAALSLRGRSDAAGFIRNFSGSQRYILDYLAEEVLTRQPADVQAFLLRTSLLAQLTGPLCDAVTGQTGGQERLAALERENLFVVPLDDQRRRYRYHHLFADLLRARLLQEGNAVIAGLHSRASAWYEANGQVGEAVEHALQAGDGERAAALLEANQLSLIAHGELAALQGWVRRLPAGAIGHRPLLCVYHAMGCAWKGQLDEAEAMLRAAEGGMTDRALSGHAAHVRSRIAGMRGDVAGAIELSLQAREQVPAENRVMQLSIATMLAYAYFMDGDLDQAEVVLNEAERMSVAGEAFNATVGVLCVLARLRCLQGRLNDAAALYRRGREIVSERGEAMRGAVAVIDAGLGDLLREGNDVPGALERLQRAIGGMQWWGKADDLALAQVWLARAQLTQGDVVGAQEALVRAQQVISGQAVFPEARAAVEAAQVRLWLARSDLAAARRWLEANHPANEREEVRIARARVLLALDRQAEATQLLGGLAAAAEAGRRGGSLIEILLLRSLALHATGQTADALADLSHALAIAAPQGYVRVFLDEGAALVPLLLEAEQRGVEAGYVRGLLGAISAQMAGERDGVPAQRLCVSAREPVSSSLLEPLSERELEVLRLMAAGLSNAEIAERLVVAVGTVKTHGHNICGKLGARNRTQAIARAREAGVI